MRLPDAIHQVGLLDAATERALQTLAPARASKYPARPIKCPKCGRPNTCRKSEIGECGCVCPCEVEYPNADQPFWHGPNPFLPKPDRNSGTSWSAPCPCPITGCTLHYGPGRMACAQHDAYVRRLGWGQKP